MRQVYSTDRWFTFPKFHETAEYVKQSMKGIGLEEVELSGAPADGSSQSGFWTMPLAWDVKAARLEIVDPSVSPLSGGSGLRMTTIDMPSVPSCSDAPPLEVLASRQFTAWLAEQRVSLAFTTYHTGKLVLVGQNPAGFKWALVKAGAIGAINAFTENPSLQDGRQWINAWGDHEDTDQDRDVENREFLPRLHAWVPRFSFHLIGEAV